MPRRSSAALVAAALAAAAALPSLYAQPPGVTASISAEGANYLLAQFIPVIEAKIGQVTIPDQPFDQDGFEGSITDIKCQSFTIGSSDIALTAPDSIGVALGGIAVACTANWNFKLKSWPHIPSGSGSVDISVSSTSADIVVGLQVASLHPQLSVESCALSIGSVDMSFHGDTILDWILDLFKSLIENAVKSNLDSSFGSIISSFVTTDVNGELANLDLDLPIAAPPPYNIAEARFGLVQTPTINASYVGVALQGDVVPIANPAVPPIAPPALPSFSPADGVHYITAYLSPYTIESAGYTYFSAGALQWTVKPSEIPLGFNTTAAYGLVAPGFNTAYPNAPVDLGIAFTGTPQLTMATSGISAVVPLSMSFNAGLANGSFVPGFVLGANASLSLALAIGPGVNTTSLVITGSLGYLDADIGLESTTVGTVNVGLLNALVNITFQVVFVPLLNDLLATGLPLPAASGLTLTNAVLGTGPGYAVIACNFTFNPSDVATFGAILDGLHGDEAGLVVVAPRKALLRGAAAAAAL